MTGLRLRRCAVIVAALGIALGGSGCRKTRADQVTTSAAVAPVVRDDSSGLLFTWIDERGEFHVEDAPAAVPEDRRDLVRVADPTHDTPTGQVYVVDLRAVGPDGTHPVRTMPRAEFEAKAVERRKANGEVLTPAAPGAPASGSGGASAEAPAPTVIIYGASWCGPCHQAEAYLKRRGVPVVKKDIEADPSAAREMQAKLAKVGRRGGSIPVIDVGGRILVGFSAGAVDRALASLGGR